jgi:hypothetical protein
MTTEPVKLTSEEKRWMPPPVSDFVNPTEEVTKFFIVLLTAFVTVLRAIVIATPTPRSSCHHGEWDLYVFSIFGLYLLVFFWCLVHDVLRLRKRAKGSLRRRLLISRLVIGGITVVLMTHNFTKPENTRDESGLDCMLSRRRGHSALLRPRTPIIGFESPRNVSHARSTRPQPPNSPI